MPHTRTKPFDLRVFISSTVSDLEEYRQAAFNAIQSLGARGDDMIHWSADERSGVQLSIDRVKHCDVLILLLAHRYGYVAAESQFGVTEMEYRTARSAGIPVLAYFLDESQPWPPDRIEWEKIDLLRAFKRRVEAEVTRKLFRSTDELGRLITQALALFMERHRDRLASSQSFEGRTLRVDPSTALKTMPDTAVHIGNAEDGLPLILRAKRSRDVGRFIEALASEISESCGSAATLTALVSTFRESIEAHSKDAWALRQLFAVRCEDGSFRDLYVTGANLSQLFRSTLALLLASARAGGTGARQRELSKRWASVIRAQTIIDAPSSQGMGLESEGGQNRFLGVDPLTGEVFSVGQRENEWVRWRSFVFESLRASFPDARFFIGERNEADYPLSELPRILMDGAIQGRGADTLLNTKVTVSISRQQIALLLADVAQRVGSMHSLGVVHGDLKPHNILLGNSGPELIDAFSIKEGDVSPGWTPHWSAPEQILGEPVSAVCDIYPIGKMIADALGGDLVGEVRKFKARPIDRELTEFDVFYNPSVYLHTGAPAASGKSLAAWAALARHCLRFAPTDRPRSAVELEMRIRELSNDHPLKGNVNISVGGELCVTTLLDGSQCVGRVIGDAEKSGGSWTEYAAGGMSTDSATHAAKESSAGSKERQYNPAEVSRRCEAGHPMASSWVTCPYCAALRHSAD
jgi:Domain of unknown function (DUF4062)/Protein kinase domain